jgi:uncharacterized protein YceK
MRRLFLISLLAAVLGGCTSVFYLTDADVATYTEQLGAQTSANETLAMWNGAIIRIEFTMTRSGDTRIPRIRSSNLRELFRERGVARFPSESLDRAGAEVERELNAWIGPELASLTDRLGARLSALTRVALIVREAPVFTFDPARGVVNFALRVKASVTGDVYVPQVDRRYANIRLDVDDYRVTGALYFGPAHPQGTRVRFTGTPRPGQVSIAGIGDREVREEIGRRLEAPLSAPVNVTRTLSYGQFAVPKLQFGQDPPTESVGRASGPRLQSTYLARPDVPDPVLHVVARSSAGSLHHGRREGGSWTAFAPVTMTEPASGDPALVSSGSDRLDVVAVATSGRLLHARFREGVWTEAATSAQAGGVRFAAGRPALLATAPGQLEVVAVSTDGLLQHVRRLDGRWVAPRSPIDDVQIRSGLVTPPFRDPVLAQAGNKLLVLFFDHRGRLFSMLFDLEVGAWGYPSEVTGSGVRGVPALASCGDGSLDLVYVRQSDGAIIHKRLSLFTGSVGSEVRSNPVVIGRLTATGDPTLACSGYRRLELLVPGPNREVFHNHYTTSGGTVDGRSYIDGWQEWQRASEQLVRSEHSPTLRALGPLESVASSTGHVHVVGPAWVAWRGASRAGQPLTMWHNSFLSQRWGRERWVSVRWRGWQETTGPSVLGRPALALVDRHVDVVLAGRDGGLHRAAVADGILARFTGGPAVASPKPDAEPMAVATAPGVLDVLYLGVDERLHHLRYRDGRPASDVRMDQRPGLTSPARPGAVAVAGHLEVVVRARDATLKHWRYRAGRWDGPLDVPDAGNVVSAPALVGTGAGGRELFAVRGDDQRVHHWRFENGQWTPPRALASDVPVNALLFTGLSASSWGDGTVDLVVAENSSRRMLHRHVAPSEPTAAPGFAAIGGPPADSIALIALGPTRLRVLGSTAGDRQFSTWSAGPPLIRRSGLLDLERSVPPATPRRGPVGPETAAPLVWSSEIFPGRRLEIAGLAALGARDLLAGAIDGQGRVYLGRFLDWRWSGFAPLYGQPLEAQPTLFMLPGFTGR